MGSGKSMPEENGNTSILPHLRASSLSVCKRGVKGDWYGRFRNLIPFLKKEVALQRQP